MPSKEQTHSDKTSSKQRLPKPVSEDLDTLAQQQLRPAAIIQQASRDPSFLTPRDVLRLQRTVGNRVVTQLLARASAGQPRPAVQAKLMVGPAGDSYEQEADRVAAQVLSMPAPTSSQPAVQRRDEEELQAKPLAATITRLVQRHDGEEEDEEPNVPEEPVPEGQNVAAVQGGVPEEEEELQAKLLQRQEEEEEELQAKPDPLGGFEAGSDVESRLAARKGGGSPLPDETREFMEPRFGADFGGVRVHADGEAAQINRELSAQAFTHGQDIYMGEGRYNPGTDAGKRLLAHELTHVVQQTGHVQRVETDKGGTPTAATGAFGEKGRLNFLSSGVAQVIQRSSKYDHIKNEVKTAYDDYDYAVKSVTEDSIVEAAKELIVEYLSGLVLYEDFDEKAVLGNAPENWQVYATGTWDAAPGLMRIPRRDGAMTAIYNGEFKPSLAHELGHAVKGSATVPQWQTAIREMAFDTKCNPRQNEELRADVTGVILRWLEGDSPKVADYNYLSGEPADDEHPAGEIRIKKITEVIELCNKVDKLVKA